MVGNVIFGVERFGNSIFGNSTFGVEILGNERFGPLIDGNEGVLIDGNPIFGADKSTPPQRTPNPQRIPKSKANKPSNPHKTQQHGVQHVFFTIGSS
jgi:hypothetical protein